MQLTAEQCDHYWTKGWLVVDGVVAADAIDRVARTRARARARPASPRRATTTRQIAHPTAPRSSRASSTARSGSTSRSGRPLLESPLPDLIRQLIGVQPQFFSDQIFFKPPRNGSIKHYHQDNAYFHLDPADHGITGWVALDDVDEANGCLRYIDGSHLGPILDAQPVPGAEHDLMPDAALIDLSKESLAPVRKGGVVFHHSKVLHGSAANTSDRWRRGYATHWISAEVTSDTGLLETGYHRRPELFAGWGERPRPLRRARPGPCSPSAKGARRATQFTLHPTRQATGDAVVVAWRATYDGRSAGRAFLVAPHETSIRSGSAQPQLGPRAVLDQARVPRHGEHPESLLLVRARLRPSA